MNRLLVTRLLFAVAFLLLAAVNGLLLSGISENQTQAPVARLWLSERELPKIKWLALENSGVGLRLQWRNLGRKGNSVDDASPSWLSGKKLEELGFVFADGVPLRDRRAKPALEREVFFVLEFNGPAYQEAIRRAERALVQVEEELRNNQGENAATSSRFQAKKRIRSEVVERSRLFVVDAGLDADHLLQLYDDPGRYIITRGIVGLSYHRENDRLWARGTIEGLRPAKLHLPLEHKKQLDRILAGKSRENVKGKQPSYEVEVAYGKRYEPWVDSVRSLQIVQEEQEKNE